MCSIEETSAHTPVPRDGHMRIGALPARAGSPAVPTCRREAPGAVHGSRFTRFVNGSAGDRSSSLARLGWDRVTMHGSLLTWQIMPCTRARTCVGTGQRALVSAKRGHRETSCVLSVVGAVVPGCQHLTSGRRRRVLDAARSSSADLRRRWADRAVARHVFSFFLLSTDRPSVHHAPVLYSCCAGCASVTVLHHVAVIGGGLT